MFALIYLCAYAASAPETYTGYYTGKVIPTPQQAEYLDAEWPLVDCAAGKALVLITYPAQGSDAERVAAQEVAARISYLAENVEIAACPEGTRPPDGTRTFIGVGTVRTSKLIQGHFEHCDTPPPDHAEGYAVVPYSHKEGFGGILLAGSDPAGAYFAAQSLVQLIERKGDTVVLHPARIVDWPAFALRSFKTGGGFGPDSDSMKMGLWSGLAKFNCYNICYTTLGKDKWVAPDPGYREHVTALVKHAVSRGLDCMPFVNPYYLWGEHIEVTDPGDLDRLYEACKIGLEAGGSRVMLCLDDFASETDRSGPNLYHVRSERDRERFGDDLAAANAFMINDLYRRLKDAYPSCTLYVCPPYYWTPRGSYKEGGEEYLRKLGAAIPGSVRIVWTGPQVRSARITTQDIEHYQSLLGGRKVMLWDNTIYMHHRPPHYFLDSFHTQYPEGFEGLISGEVHLNAGAGEAYKCGLLAAADYLWNPAAYDPEQSIRNAIAAVAGPDMVDDLLAFRDAFYTIYDEWGAQFGSPKQMLKTAKTLSHRPFDESDVRDVMQVLDQQAELADRIAEGCGNAGLVAEVLQHRDRHTGYREAFETLAALPAGGEEALANVAPNHDAETMNGKHPDGWGLYKGAGKATLDAAEGRNGGHAGRLIATEQHDWGDGRKSINVAMMIGDCNGFTGPGAPELLPLHRYYFSFWLRGDAPRVVVGVTTWADSGEKATRGSAKVDLEPFAATDEWRFYSGRFITPANAARGALRIGIEGFDAEGGGLGEVLVDDVYVGRSRAAASEEQTQ